MADPGLTQDYAIADALREIPETALYALHYYGTTRYFDTELQAVGFRDQLSRYEQEASAILPTPRLRARRASAALAAVTAEKLAIRAANGDRIAAAEITRRSNE